MGIGCRAGGYTSLVRPAAVDLVCRSTSVPPSSWPVRIPRSLHGRGALRTHEHGGPLELASSGHHDAHGLDAIRPQRVLVWLGIVIFVAAVRARPTTASSNATPRRHHLPASVPWLAVRVFRRAVHPQCLVGFVVPPSWPVATGGRRHRLTAWVSPVPRPVIGVAAFGVTTTFVMAVIAVVVVDRVRSVRRP